MKNEIKNISTNIKLSLENLLTQKENLVDKLEIEISELYGNSDNIREIKLTLIEKDFDLFHSETLNEELAKLKIINTFLNNPDTTKFIKNLENFIFNFIEIREIWKIIDWKYYYDIFDNEIHLFSSRKALIRRISVEKGYTLSLKKEINKNSKRQFSSKFNKEVAKLINENSLINKILDFRILIDKLRENAYNSFAESIKYEWNKLITDENLTKAQYSVLAFILRTSIELSLKNHPLIIADNSNIKMLGGIFKKLQENNIFIKEKDEIEKKLRPLNKLVHNEINEITKDKIISIKDFFSTLLLSQNLKLPL